MYTNRVDKFNKKEVSRFDSFWSRTKTQSSSVQFHHVWDYLPDNITSILDVGGGLGGLYYSHEKENKFHYVLVEGSVEAVRKAKENNLTAIWHDVDNYPLPFSDNSFDLVFASDFLEHMRNPWAVLAEMARVSKKYVFVSGPNMAGWKCRLELLFGRPISPMAADKYGAVVDKYGRHTDHIYLMTYKNLIHWANKLRLRVLKSRAFWYRRYFLFRWFLEPLFKNFGQVYEVIFLKDGPLNVSDPNFKFNQQYYEKGANNYGKMWDDFSRNKSESYLDYKFNPRHRVGLTNYLRENFIYEFLSPRKDDVVLDAGCASGRQLFTLRHKIKEGYGTDIGEGFIAQANAEKQKIRADNLFFQRVEIEHLPFKGEFFDKIICAEVLEHIPDKDAGLKELLRILKKDGILVITVPNLNSDGTLWGRFLRIIGTRKFTPIKSFSEEELSRHGDCHVRQFNRKDISEWLGKNGLEILDIKSASFIDGPFIDFLLKLLLHFDLSRKIVIAFEKFFTKLNFFFGRHLIIKLRKK